MPRRLPALRRCAKTQKLIEGDVARSWTKHRFAGTPRPAISGPSSCGAWRFRATLAAGELPLGLRKSQLQIQLYGVRFSAPESQSKVAKSWQIFLPSHGRRFSPEQFLDAVLISSRDLGLSLGWAAGLVSQPRLARFLCQSAERLIKVIETIHAEAPKEKTQTKPEGAGAVRALGDLRLPFDQQVACLLVERPGDFGLQALPLFCRLASNGGRPAFRKVTDDQIGALVRRICEDRGTLSTWKGNDAAELFCALSRLGLRMTQTLAGLTRIIGEKVQEVDPENLPMLARALGRGDWHEEYVLLHAICRQGSLALQEGVLNAQAACIFMLVCSNSKWEIFDEELLQNASKAFQDGAKDLSTRELCDVIYAVSNFQVRDVMVLEGVCAELTRRAEARRFGEADLVKLARGLLKLRHHDETLMNALAPLVLELQEKMMPVSLCNLMSALSYFAVQNADFYASLLQNIAQRTKKLQPISVQQFLTALCRLQGQVASERLQEPLEKLCEHIAQMALHCKFSGPAPFTPVQAMSSLSALANLQQRDLASASVFTSVLCGCPQVNWHWARSSQYYVRGVLGSPPFQEAGCRSVMDMLDSSRCVEILQSLASLELNSRLTVHLTAMLCALLAPQLHDLRAKEVLVVARAFSVERIPDSLWTGGDSAGWRERALDLCFQSLRRHEHFLDTSYFTLLPFKLLCLQVNLGAFGTRKLEDFLNPMLLAFVDRLRNLTREECEANRSRREGEEDDGESLVQNEVMNQRPGPSEIDGEHHRILLGSYLGDLRVDLLLEKS